MFRQRTETHPSKFFCKLVAAAFIAALSTHATAEYQSGLYEMTAVSTAANGGLIIDGKYDAAIRNNLRQKYHKDKFALNTNLCVAYTMTGQFEQASAFCDEAVRISEGDIRLQAKRLFGMRTPAIDAVQLRWRAVAHSNRGILRYATGNLADAHEDFELAAGLNVPRLNVATNLARFEAQQPGW